MVKHKVTKKSEYYKVEGDKVVRTKKVCPKCGPGVFMADHGDRYHCGRCGYTEFKNKE
jgi:small subunit ribosomal protein S27Ae